MALLRRLLVTLSQLALLLPFVVLRSCHNDRRTAMTGVDIVTHGGAPWLLLTTVLAAAFLLRPMGETRAVGEPLRALGATLAGLAVLGAAAFAGMFGRIDLRVGFWLALGSWAGVWVSCLAVGFHAPFGWALGAMAAVPGLIAVAAGVAQGDSPQVVVASVLTVLLVAPLLPLLGALEGRSRRVAWGVGAALAFAAGFVAYSDGMVFTAIGLAAGLLATWRALG